MVRKAKSRFSGSSHSSDSSPTPADVDRHRKRKMATTKPEVVICYVLRQTDTWFETLYPGLPSHPTGWTHHQHPPTSTDTGNARWRPSNRKQLYITFYNRYTRGSNGYTWVFWVARQDRLIADIRRRRPGDTKSLGLAIETSCIYLL